MDETPDLTALLGKELAGKVSVITVTPDDLANPDALISRITQSLPTAFPNPLGVVSSSPHPGVLRLTRYVRGGGHPAPRATLLVNTNPQPVEVSLEVAYMCDPVLYDPMSDEIIPCEFTPVEGDRHAFTVTLDTHQSLIVRER
jgi:hypothetical protein